LLQNLFGQTQPLPLLCIGSALLVIGIAVDGIFVFIDMFKQSTAKDLQSRMVRCAFFGRKLHSMILLGPRLLASSE
jgi:hypothetical protein